jgi:hypothetical protein
MFSLSRLFSGDDDSRRMLRGRVRVQVRVGHSIGRA